MKQGVARYGGIGLVVVGTILSTHGRLAWSHEGPPIVGTVIDTLCYVEYGGPADVASEPFKRYLECSKRGVNSGHPVALKIDGQYYLVVDMRFQSMNTTLAPFMGQQITVHGTLLDADNLHVIAIEHLVDEHDKAPEAPTEHAH